MCQGKHHKRTVKSVALVVSTLLLLCVTISGTVAFLVAKTVPKVNVFESSSVTTTIDETFSSGVKSNVSIKNTGDTTAYIRAAVVVTWKDEAGNVCGQKPIAGTDYRITFDLENGWKKGADGFYYWTKPVKSVSEDEENCKTGVLITEAEAISELTVGGIAYYLSIEIIGSGIQSNPASVVTSVWSSGVSSVDDGGTLSIKQ